MERQTKGYEIRGAGESGDPDDSGVARSGGGRAGAGTPAVEEMAAIDALSLAPLDPGEVYSRRVMLCNDRYDRDHERLPPAYLARFAETLPGRALLACHSAYDLPSILGRFYAAEVTERNGASWLECAFYMRKTPGNQEVRDQIDAGVYSYASIGFLYDALLCDLCGEDYWGWECDHYEGMPDRKSGVVCTCTYGGRIDRVEAIEGSLVYLGAQYGAALTKSAGARAAKEEVRAKRTERIFGSGGRFDDRFRNGNPSMTEARRLEAQLELYRMTG